jgi:YD repeat-containing protein
MAVTGSSTSTWSYTYDPLGRLKSASNANNGSQNAVYAYDKNDNMTFNSALGCGSNPNISYGAGNSTIVGRAGDAGAGGPHAPSAICSVGITYDKNGNTLSYDNDGSAGQPPLNLVYDGENRPVTVSRAGVTTTYAYGPDGERVRKGTASAPITWYMGGEAELDQATGIMTSYVTPTIKRVGSSGKTGFAHQDHLGTNRAVIYPYFGSSNEYADYGPYGAPAVKFYEKITARLSSADLKKA